MRRRISILTILLTVVLPLIARDNRYESYFISLDSVIEQRASYVKEREAQIADLCYQNTRAHEDAEHYLINSLLIDKYRYYICDSALAYLDRNEIIARRINRQDNLNEIYLDKCDLFIRTGAVNNAQEEFNRINIGTIPDRIKARYYALKIFLLVQETNSSYDMLLDNPEIIRNAGELAKYTKTNDIGNVWATMWGYRGADRNSKLIALLSAQYENDLRSKNMEAGDMAIVLARQYRIDRNENLWIKYLCLGAAYNIVQLKLDPSALLDLVSWLLENGDSKRAYRYLDYVLQSQVYYPDRVRSAQMAQYMKRIFEQTQKANVRSREKINLYLRGLTIGFSLSLLFLILIAYSIIKLKRQKEILAEVNRKLKDYIMQLSETQKELLQTNQKMSAASTEIEETNHRLAEANFIKEEYIGYVFAICSEYIDKMQSLRQNINRRLTTGQIDEAVRLTRSEGDNINREVKELNHKIDAIFLSIYPDFVSDFNELLLPEERFALRKDEQFNTDLRIFALIWLGFDSSAKIANLLHLSTQTVYNSRMKMRNKASIEPESFNERVQRLGRGKLCGDKPLNS